MKTNGTRRISILAAGLLLALTGALAAQAPAITRTVLQRADVSWAGHEVVTAKADFPVNGSTGKHTHPGEEVSYVSEGTISLEVAGSAAKTLKAGDTFIIPSGTVHNATATGGAKAVVIANYFVEKGKPLTTPVQ